MRTTSWLGLVAVTIVVIVAAVYVVDQQQAALNTAPGSVGPLYPGLLAEVNDVRSIEVASAKQDFTIARPKAGDGPWVIAAKGNYPADPNQVKAAVVGIAELKTLSPRTDDPALYDQIGVGDIKDPKSDAVRLVLKDGSGKVLAALLVGKTASYATDTEPAQLYVRKEGEKRSWLVQGRLNVRAKPVTWMKTQIIAVPRHRIMRVEVTPEKGQPFTIERSAPTQENFTVLGLPKGVNPKITNVNGISAALDLVTFDDVAPAKGIDFTKAARVVYHTFDGLVVTVETVTHDKKPWTIFSAAVDPAQAKKEAEAKAETPPTAVAKGKPGGSAKAAAKPAEKPAAASATLDAAAVEKVTKEADALNKALAGWTYQLPDYRSVNFTRTIAAVEMKGPAEVEKDAHAH